MPMGLQIVVSFFLIYGFPLPWYTPIKGNLFPIGHNSIHVFGFQIEK